MARFATLVVLAAWHLSAQLIGAEPYPTANREHLDPALAQLVTSALPGPEAGVVGLAVKHLPTGRVAYLNADTPFDAASLLKLPSLYEAYRQRSSGGLSFQEPLVVTERHVELALGWSAVSVGERLSVDQALELMISVSDNTSAVALLDRLGYSSVNLAAEELGLERTVVGLDSTTTARDMLRYFEVLARLEAVDPDASREMLLRLLRQRVDDRIPRFLPLGTLVAHKTGDNPGVIHDAGVIYTPAGPLVLALLTKDVTDGPRVRLGMARLASALYEYAYSGGFGRPTHPPLLWDPALDARMRASLPRPTEAVSLAIKHLGTGQGVLVNSNQAWPSGELLQLTVMVETEYANERRSPSAAPISQLRPAVSRAGRELSGLTMVIPLRSALGYLAEGDNRGLAPAVDYRVSDSEADDLVGRAFTYDPERDAWLAGLRPMVDLVERVGAGRVVGEPAGRALRWPLPRYGVSGLVQRPPHSALLADLVSTDDGYHHQIALMTVGGGPSVVAVSGRDLDARDLATIQSTVHEYFQRCTWGTQEADADCSR